MGKGKASILDPDPHSLIDVFYGMKINYYLLFFSGEIKFDCLNGAKRLSDSWGEEDLAAETGAAPEIEFTDMDLAACADNLVPVVDAGGGTPHDPLFTLNEGSLPPASAAPAPGSLSRRGFSCSSRSEKGLRAVLKLSLNLLILPPPCRQETVCSILTSQRSLSITAA
jgi:hypothetical protein